MILVCLMSKPTFNKVYVLWKLHFWPFSVILSVNSDILERQERLYFIVVHVCRPLLVTSQNKTSSQQCGWFFYDDTRQMFTFYAANQNTRNNCCWYTILIVLNRRFFENTGDRSRNKSECQSGDSDATQVDWQGAQSIVCHIRSLSTNQRHRVGLRDEFFKAEEILRKCVGSRSVCPSILGIIDKLFSVWRSCLVPTDRPTQTRVWWPTRKGGTRGSSRC